MTSAPASGGAFLWPNSPSPPAGRRDAAPTPGAARWAAPDRCASRSAARHHRRPSREGTSRRISATAPDRLCATSKTIGRPEAASVPLAEQVVAASASPVSRRAVLFRPSSPSPMLDPGFLTPPRPRPPAPGRRRPLIGQDRGQPAPLLIGDIEPAAQILDRPMSVIEAGS